MTRIAPIHGVLQTQVMAAIWRRGAGTVEQIRAELPARHRGAYTTVQTVLNRLADQALVDRRREGRRIVYRPSVTEAQYLSGTIEHTLAGASTEARQAALASLIGSMQPDELAAVEALAAQARTARGELRR